MKKVILFVAALAMTTFTMSAQDINQATEMYNNGAMELQMGNNATALEHFKNALQAGEALGDEGCRTLQTHAGHARHRCHDKYDRCGVPLH